MLGPLRLLPRLLLLKRSLRLQYDRSPRILVRYFLKRLDQAKYLQILDAVWHGNYSFEKIEY